MKSRKNNFQVQEATIEDIDGIYALLLQLIDSIDNTEGLNEHVVRKNILHTFDNETEKIFIAVYKECVIGCIYLSQHQSLLHDAPSIIIDELIVDEHYRGMGVGDMLFERAVAYARENNFAELEVSTEFSNKKAADFYRLLGFKERGILFEQDLD